MSSSTGVQLRLETMATCYGILVLILLCPMLFKTILSTKACPDGCVCNIFSMNYDSNNCPKLYCTCLFSCNTLIILDDLTFDNCILDLNRHPPLHIYKIHLVGSSASGKVTIHCRGNSGITFMGMTEIEIINLHFEGCSINILPHFRSVPWGREGSAQTFNNILIWNSSFSSQVGPAIVLWNSYMNVTIGYSSFTGNRSLLKDSSGGIVIRSTPCRYYRFLINIIGCNFTSNINRKISVISGNEHSNKNLFRYGGAIDIVSRSYASVSIENCTFIDNEAVDGGAIRVLVQGGISNMSLIGSNFSNNAVSGVGGAVSFAYYAVHSTYRKATFMLKVLNSSFVNNSAHQGGALAASISSFELYPLANISLFGTHWTNNSASDFGFAIMVQNSKVGHSQKSDSGSNTTIILADSKFENNFGFSSHSRGSLWAQNLQITLNGSFVNFTNNVGTAIALQDTQLCFETDVVFQANSGYLGGAIFISGGSLLLFSSSFNVTFLNNTASVMGGAIYSIADCCTFDLPLNNTSHVLFNGNTAAFMVQSIYIENMEELACSNYSADFQFYPSEITEVLLQLHSVEIQALPKAVMLGETFQLKVTNLSDICGRPSIGVGRIVLINSNSGMLKGDYKIRGPNVISLNNYTGVINFIFTGPQLQNSLNLTVRILFQTTELSIMGRAEVNISLVPCRFGYEYFNNGSCGCASGVDKHIQCGMGGHDLCVDRHYWYSKKLSKAYPCPARNCWYTASQCASNASNCDVRNYCSVSGAEDICRTGRSGFLCSLCNKNYSYTFSGLSCTSIKSCNSAILLFIVFVYWIIMAVVVLSGVFLHINTASGVLNGIVYFISVAAIYTETSELYSEEWVQVLIGIAKSVLLLDPEVLGYINLCFVESWTSPLTHELFRYATPLFVMLVLCGFAILVRCSDKIQQLSKAKFSLVRASCLLILLSYTSISYTSLKLLIPMEVNGSLVVQVAPNVSYFSNEHAPYAFVGMCVTLFFTLPICIFLLLSPMMSKRACMDRCHLKIIIDEFQACYRPKHKWFAGFYFMNRLIFFLVNGLVMEPFPHYNNVLTAVNIVVLLIHLVLQPYSRKWLNILDATLLADIVIMSNSSPLEGELANTVNGLLYTYIIPYALIAYPAVYLLTVLTLVVLLVVARLNCAKKIPLLSQLHKTSRRVNGVNIGRHATSSLVHRLYPYRRSYRDSLLKDINDNSVKTESYGSIF